MLESVLTWIVDTLTTTSSTNRILLLGMLFLVLYFALIWFVMENQKSLAVATAFLPILILDYYVSFGTYKFILPFFEYTVNKFYLTLSGLDFIFNFGIFKLWGLQTYNQVSGVVTLTTIQNISVYLFAFGDSILLLILLSYFFYYIINGIDNSKSIAFLSAMFIVLLSMGYFNAKQELATSTQTMQHIIFFINHATTEQLLIVGGAFFVSFLAVWAVLSIFINLFVTTATHTVMPGMEARTWSINLSGLAFSYTLIYMSIIFLHPEYSMWAILPGIVIFAWIKSLLSGYSDKKRGQMQMQQREYRDYQE